MRKTFLLSLCLSGILLTGCSTLGNEEETSPAQAEQASDTRAEEAAPQAAGEEGAEKEKPATVERPFQANILYGLLAAEMAAERGRFDVTLINYVEAAKRTRDPGVIRRAMQFAQGLGADNAQYQVAKTWLDVDPDNLEALRVASVQAIKHNDYETALGYMEKIYAQDERAGFDNLGNYAAGLPAEEQEKLIDTFQKLLAEHPKRSEIAFNLAVLQYTVGRADEAIATLKPLLEKDAEYQPAIALYSTLLFEAGERDEAVSYLRSQTRRYPESRKLGTLYARMLVDAKQLQAAQDEFERLTELSPENHTLRLSYALVALENNQSKLAREQLEMLLEQNAHVNEAHFYLGRLTESTGKSDKALSHYLQVEGGPQFFSALTRAGEIQAEQGELDTALDRLERLRLRMPDQADRLWLVEVDLLNDIDRPYEAVAAADQAIAEFPENVSLRYARSMINDQLGNLAAAEQDLRWIIEHEPDNPVALNALGYTLTVKTDRYDEAMELISRAHELAPDNPAILDSLGWLHFKMGNNQKALDYIRTAYENFPDPEVAAHLGEILWSQGRQDDARRIWSHALDEHGQDDILIETLERLGVNLESD